MYTPKQLQQTLRIIEEEYLFNQARYLVSEIGRKLETTRREIGACRTSEEAYEVLHKNLKTHAQVGKGEESVEAAYDGSGFVLAVRVGDVLSRADEIDEDADWDEEG